MEMRQDIPDEQKQGIAAWTEYDLYWVYAAVTRCFNKYHVRASLAHPTANLWEQEDVDRWKPCDHAEEEAPREGQPTALWATVQSRLGMDASDIWKRLEPCMQKH